MASSQLADVGSRGARGLLRHLFVLTAVTAAGCGTDPLVILDSFAHVDSFTAEPARLRAGENTKLSWIAAADTVSITVGDCPGRTVGSDGTAYGPCPGEQTIQDRLRPSGSIAVAPVQTSKYWCTPRGGAGGLPRVAAVVTGPNSAPALDRASPLRMA